MIVKSVIDENYLKGIIENSYTDFNNIKCHFFREGRNDTYIVLNESKEFYFRIYRASHRTEKEINSEIAILNFLSKRGMNVGLPVSLSNSNYVTNFTAPEGIRHGVLFEGVNGSAKKNKFNQTDSYQFGEYCGELHKTLDSFPLEKLNRPSYNLDYLLNESFTNFQASYLYELDVNHFLEELFLKLKEKLNTYSFQNSTDFNWGICHGDLNTGNVKFHSDKVSLFDFDELCFSWRVYDISCFLWDLYYPIIESTLTIAEERKRNYNSFLEGYCRHYSLLNTEIEFSKYFVLVRDFWLINLHLEKILFTGRNSYLKNYLDNSISLIKSQITENSIQL